MIAFIPTSSNGGRDLRSVWPAAVLRSHGHGAIVTGGWPGGLPEGSSIVIHRPLATDVLEWVTAYRAAGFEVWVQEDDDLSDVPALNHWQPDPEMLERHDASVRAASGVIVTSDRLARVYGSMAERCLVIRNRLASWIGDVRFHKARTETEVRVGWAGHLNVHRQDIAWIAPVIHEMTRGALFTSIGDMRTPRMLGVSLTAEVFPWTDDQREYHWRMARADIGIVPLEPCPFNEAKSWYKALQYLSLGKPVVATDLHEQRLLITHGVEGFLARTPAEFAEYVQLLVHDAALRRTMAEAARARGAELAIEHSKEWDVLVGRVRDRHLPAARGRQRRAPRASVA